MPKGVGDNVANSLTTRERSHHIFCFFSLPTIVSVACPTGPHPPLRLARRPNRGQKGGGGLDPRLRYMPVMFLSRVGSALPPSSIVKSMHQGTTCTSLSPTRPRNRAITPSNTTPPALGVGRFGSPSHSHVESSPLTSATAPTLLLLIKARLGQRLLR